MNDLLKKSFNLLFNEIRLVKLCGYLPNESFWFWHREQT